MAVVATDITGWINGEFSSLTEVQVTPFLERAARRIDASVWGDRFDDAHLYLTMHMIAVARRLSSDGNSVTQVTAGPLSRQFAQKPDASELDSTTFGRVFLQMLAEIPKGPVVLA